MTAPGVLLRLIIVALVLSTAGCGADEPADWRLKDIAGLMPRLEFELTNHEGRQVTAEDYRGKVKLLFFGFTNCPDVCPMTLAHLSGAVKRLGERAEQVRVLFVTVDPQRDTQRALAEYMGHFGEQFVGLRGDTETLKALTKRYRVTYSHGEPDAEGNYPVSHSSAVFIFDRQGEVRLMARRTSDMSAITEDLQRLLASQG